MTPRDLDPLILAALDQADAPMMCGDIAAQLHRTLASRIPDLRARDALCTATRVRDRLAALRLRGKVAVATRQYDRTERRIVSRFTAIRPDGKPRHVVTPQPERRDTVIAALRELHAAVILSPRHAEACRIAVELLREDARSHAVTSPVEPAAPIVEPGAPQPAGARATSRDCTLQDLVRPPDPPTALDLERQALIDKAVREAKARAAMLRDRGMTMPGED